MMVRVSAASLDLVIVYSQKNLWMGGRQFHERIETASRTAGLRLFFHTFTRAVTSGLHQHVNNRFTRHVDFMHIMALT